MIYNNITTDQERALYAISNATVTNCEFSGPADGESALKECRNITVDRCRFYLRYALWHLEEGKISNIYMSEECRAPLWYDKDVTIADSDMHGIKALRECDRVSIENCTIESDEFGWLCRDIRIMDTSLTTEYPFLQTKRMEIDNLTLNGKYSFQYAQDVVVRNSNFATKDAFWHSKNVTVYDSTIKGEYLGWYAQNLRLVRCKIIGTQPLCYVENLVMEDCEMVDCDLSFENSTVDATLVGTVTSVKNPAGGRIVADGYGEIILDENVRPGTHTDIITRT